RSALNLYGIYSILKRTERTQYQPTGGPCNNATGYNQRSRGETLMGRWKVVIGPKLKARTFENQKTEAKIGVRVLNWMTGLGHPSFERTA
ncbi:hypothetical protein SAMN04488512_12932, partial [Sulfitobacter litoralis]